MYTKIISAFLFIALFVACLLAGEWVDDKFHLDLRSPEEHLPEGLSFADFDMGFVPCSADSMDHSIYYYGLSPALENARKADIVFAGNSRLQYSLSYNELTKFKLQTGKTGFALGFGNGEGVDFAKMILARNNIHPKILVVNGDGFFFRYLSYHAKAVIDSNFVSAYQALLECRLSFWARNKIQSHFPRPAEKSNSGVAMRSKENGAYVLLHWPDAKMPLNRTKELPRGHITNEVLNEVKQFKSELEKDGTKLVIMYVPNNNPMSSLEDLKWLTEQLQVSLVISDLEDLTLLDGSHLSPTSADRFTADILEKIRHTPEFKNL